ncbi:MAG: Gfo/Idh/MocA family oxidoreductase [Phycisphaeraceae bacterium]
MAKWKIAGINFDHMHMGDLLRQVHEHPDTEIVGICDEHPNRMQDAVAKFNIPAERVFTDYRKCMETAKPDLVVLCPATATHGEWTQKIAPFGSHILMEKPFAATVAEADAMTEAVAMTGRQLAINWPLAWYPSHRTTKRLIDEGRIGDVIEVHYYDGNRGPVHHKADKEEVSPAEALEAKRNSWFYRAADGGGSLLDYLGYGTTLGTWFMNGRAPIEVTCTTHIPDGLEVDEHSITVARYETGLSKFETRWGTYTDPWTHQPQPKCGFVVVGRAGTISSYDYADTIRVQTADHPEGEVVPVDQLQPPLQNPIQYVLDRIANNAPIEGPLSPAMCRIGQQIVDTAFRSAQEKRTLPLIQ